MEPSITMPDITSGNEVSNIMILCLKPPSSTSEQAHTRFPRPVLQPTTNDYQAPQPVVPMTPKPKPAVPVSTPATTPQVTPLSTPTTTPSVASMQPQRSGHDLTAPKCLVTEM